MFYLCVNTASMYPYTHEGKNVYPWYGLQAGTRHQTYLTENTY